jgi:hypothetical protein
MSAMSNQIDDGGPAYPHVEVDAKTGEVTNHNGMSLRAYAAIQLRVPSSGIDWLDDMIIDAKRDEFASRAMAGVVCSDGRPSKNSQKAEFCYDLADSLLTADCALAARKEKP